MAKVYEIITDQIVKKLSEGDVPWHKPWQGGDSPRNLVSGKPYRGINVFLLALQPYASTYWLSFKQCKARGGNVKKGEKGSMICFYKTVKGERENKKGEKESTTFPLLRYYYVFNVEQCEGVEYPKPVFKEPGERIAECERVVEGMPQKPELKFEEQRAFYNPNFDFVNMPKYESFGKVEEYYSTLFHELAHSTGHDTRLKRKNFSCNFFGDHNYSHEELVAEMTAAFLCGRTGIERVTLDNSAAYIKSWTGKIKADPKLIITTASQAQKAADFIINVKKEVENGSGNTNG